MCQHFVGNFLSFFAFLYENYFDILNFNFTITDIVNISLDLYLQKKIYINSCQNRNRYFIPVNRRDEKYYNY